MEVMIEQWNNLDGSTDFLWSVWRDGARVHMGGRNETAEAAEIEALDFCAKHFGRTPDSVTKL